MRSESPATTINDPARDDRTSTEVERELRPVRISRRLLFTPDEIARLLTKVK